MATVKHHIKYRWHGVIEGWQIYSGSTVQPQQGPKRSLYVSNAMSDGSFMTAQHELKGNFSDVTILGLYYEISIRLVVQYETMA